VKEDDEFGAGEAARETTPDCSPTGIFPFTCPPLRVSTLLVEPTGPYP